MSTKSRAIINAHLAKITEEKAFTSPSETLEDYYVQAIRRLQRQIKPSVFKVSKKKAISK